MTKTADDFEAAKQIAAILEPFDISDRERILRWSRDKLGMGDVSTPGSGAPVVRLRDIYPVQSFQGLSVSDKPIDIRTFIESKKPRTDTQLAAVVAYYHRFVAPDEKRKDSISKEDILSACRLANRVRPPRPQQTLVNAFAAGYFDKADRGQYQLNSVGENLVAVALPDGTSNDAPSSSPRAKAARSGPKGKKKKKSVRRKGVRS